MYPSALPDVIRCPASCDTTVANFGRFEDSDEDTVQHLRRFGWQVVDGEWTCPNDLPSIRRDLPGAMGRAPNSHCLKCGDTRGGAYGHETDECVWKLAVPPSRALLLD